MAVVTRFAPSPTGYLHVGSVRTALYSWLYAKKHGGQFVLRIEDTDLERSTDASVQTILEGMEWLGLSWQQGPFYQSKRMDRYKEVIKKLVSEGHAYRCYCSKDRLEKLRAEQMVAKKKPRYDGHCRDQPRQDDKPYVIRFKNPLEGSVEFNDLVHGAVEFQNNELDDLVLARTDGVPTYNLTVVVDDWDMGVTHVIRGNDHVNNTPRQVNILMSLGAPIPQYIHVPMILGNDGKRLSKRHGAVSVMQYREDGFLPEALLNYLVRLGWSHGDQEIFSVDEMIDHFDLSHINKSAGAFDTEKLLWLNQHYIRTLDSERVCRELAWHLNRKGVNIDQGPPLLAVLKAQQERCKTLKEMAEKSTYFYLSKVSPEKKLVCKFLTEDGRNILRLLKERLIGLVDWQKDAIHEVVVNVAEELVLKLGKVAQPLRVAVTGGVVSPPIDLTLELLGQKLTLDRLDAVLLSDFIDKSSSSP